MAQKYKAIEDDLFYVDARKEANRITKVRKISRESQEAMNALE